MCAIDSGCQPRSREARLSLLSSVGIAAIVLCYGAAPGGTGPIRRSVRLKDLLITVTGVGDIHPDNVKAYGERPRPGYHFVGVTATVENLGIRESHTSFGVCLKVDRGFEYDEDPGFGLHRPRGFGLLRSDVSNGAYVFETKDGTKPALLVLFPGTSMAVGCRYPAEPHGSRILVPLRGLPEPEPTSLKGR